MTTPQHITFTGLDPWTDLVRAAEMARRWPIEWGVLFSPSRQGLDPRYPALSWIDFLQGRADLRLAAHLCGGHADGVLIGFSEPEIDHLMPMFGRIQINTIRSRVEIDTVRNFAEEFGARAILQTRALDTFPDDPRVDWLYDPSGGQGRAPRDKRWPGRAAGSEALVGYAGGLGPDTIAESHGLIQAAVGQAPYWIDMETHVRTGHRLDLDKCEAVCRAVYGEGR